ncbi:VOC family protein [Arthrobacter sunyaminii]|uniref:VOC family protein n=1 Tax=Arthrobacter sunyaminii TaxID=2816859 RepID=A0A975PDD3_9MICC|nr:VOC family protein [Arthrobacter sunyaminii]MBO0907456.1 VOC family protein [Arthrobacter sunyaminii]QWQ35034.1 VOC family protein [Arthrobacter sunyaminii]
MKPSLSVITAGVRDLEVTYAFYSSRLGWEAVQHVPEEVIFYQVGPGLLLAFFRRDHLAAEAGPMGEAAAAPVTLGHNVGSAAEVDAVLAEAAAAGGSVTAPGTQMSWGGYSGYFTDPDGYRWEVCHNPGLRIEADGHVTLEVIDPIDTDPAQVALSDLTG